MRPLWWSGVLAVVVSVPGVGAGTLEHPELTDAAGDVDPMGLDILAAWVVERATNGMDDDRGSTDIHLQLAVPPSLTDVGVVDVTWAAGPAFVPGTTSSQRGVRFTWQLGAATWAPLVEEGGVWTVGVSADADGEPTAGHLVATGAPTGGGVITRMREFHAQSRLAAADVIVDEATGDGAFERQAPFRVVPAVTVPDRAADIVDPVDPILGSVDLTRAWLDEREDGLLVTAEFRSLDGSEILGCEWWRVNLFAMEVLDGGDLILSSYESLTMDEGVVSMAFQGASRRWEPRGKDLGYDPLDDEGGRRTSGSEEDESPVQVDLAFGMPGYATLWMPGITWNGTAPITGGYHSIGTSCQSARGTQGDDTREDQNPSILAPGANVGFVLACLAAAMAIVRRQQT